MSKIAEVRKITRAKITTFTVLVSNLYKEIFGEVDLFAPLLRGIEALTLV